MPFVVRNDAGPGVRIRVAGLVVVAALLTLGGAAARGRAPKARTLVVLAAQNRPDVTRRALGALRSQVSDTSVVLRVVWIKRLAGSRASQIALSRRHAAKKGVLAVAWYDGSQPNEILMIAARTNRLVVRRVTGATLGGRLEALAIIVRTSMLALVAGQPLPPQPPPRRRVEPRRVVPRRRVKPRRVVPRRRVEPRRRVAPRRRPPPRRRPLPARPAGWRFGLGVEAGYFLSGYSVGAGAVHGGEVAVAFHLRAGWEVLVSYRVTQKITGRVGASRLDLQPHPIGLGARWRHRWGRFDLGLALSVIMDYATLSTDADPDTYWASADQGDLLWSVMPTISGSVTLIPRLRVVLAVGAQVGLNWRRYVLDDQVATEPLLSPWPVQPFMMIGLSADIL